MKHGDPTPLTDPQWILTDDPDLALVTADMHQWALANEQDHDDPIPEEEP